MWELQQGIKENLNISFYLSENFEARQMAEIRKGLKDNLDVSIYANPEFDSFQMNLIRTGLKEGLDVRQFAYPEYNLREMIRVYNQLKKEKLSLDCLIQEASQESNFNQNKCTNKEKQNFKQEMFI